MNAQTKPTLSFASGNGPPDDHLSKTAAKVAALLSGKLHPELIATARSLIVAARESADDDRSARLIREIDLIVMQADGKWQVMEKWTDRVLTVCDSNSAAWQWIDRNSGAGQTDYDRHYRIRNSERFS